MLMDNLYNNVKLCRDAFLEKKMFHYVTRTHGRGVTVETIQKEVKNKEKQGEVRGEVKVAVMKGDTTCPYVLSCSL